VNLFPFHDLIVLRGELKFDTNNVDDKELLLKADGYQLITPRGCGGWCTMRVCFSGGEEWMLTPPILTFLLWKLFWMGESNDTKIMELYDTKAGWQWQEAKQEMSRQTFAMGGPIRTGRADKKV